MKAVLKLMLVFGLSRIALGGAPNKDLCSLSFKALTLFSSGTVGVPKASTINLIPYPSKAFAPYYRTYVELGAGKGLQFSDFSPEQKVDLLIRIKQSGLRINFSTQAAPFKEIKTIPDRVVSISKKGKWTEVVFENEPEGYRLEQVLSAILQRDSFEEQMTKLGFDVSKEEASISAHGEFVASLHEPVSPPQTKMSNFFTTWSELGGEAGPKVLEHLTETEREDHFRALAESKLPVTLEWGFNKKVKTKVIDVFEEEGVRYVQTHDHGTITLMDVKSTELKASDLWEQALDKLDKYNYKKDLFIEKAPPAKILFFKGMDDYSTSKSNYSDVFKLFQNAANPEVRESTLSQLIAQAEKEGVKVETASVGPIKGVPLARPFGTFRVDGVEYNYDSLGENEKKTSKGKNEVYYGRPLREGETLDGVIARFFTKGVLRDGKGHFDVSTHQLSDEGAKKSGFSNATENYSVGVGFASDTQSGIVFVVDPSREEILNLNEFYRSRGNTNSYKTEAEILWKGGRDPRNSIAAIVFKDLRITRIVLNPNYVKSEAPTTPKPD